MAHWLFWTNSTVWALKTPAKFSASRKSPCEVAPSPIDADRHVRLVLQRKAHAGADRVQRLVADHDLDRERRRSAVDRPASTGRGSRRTARPGPGRACTARSPRDTTERSSRPARIARPSPACAASWPIIGPQTPTSALALELQSALVELAAEDHPAVQRRQLVVRQLRLVAAAARPSASSTRNGSGVAGQRRNARGERSARCRSPRPPRSAHDTLISHASMDVSIVIPAYNEARRLPATLGGWHAYLGWAAVCLGSRRRRRRQPRRDR